MKKLLVVILLILAVHVKAQKQTGLVTCQVQEMPFSEFCEMVYKQTLIKVYYQQKWVNQLRVTLSIRSVPALYALEEALKGSDLLVSVWYGHLVVLPGEKLITTLPDYNKEKGISILNDSMGGNFTKSEEKYLTGRRSDMPGILQVGRKGAALPGSKVRIKARILDEETGEPLYSASMYVTETQSGAVSDVDGYLLLTMQPGTYNILVEYLGYEKKKYQLELFSDGNFTLALRKMAIQIKEFVVYGDRQMNIKAKDPGLDKMSIKTIKQLPMMMGERDILKVSVTLPGIVSVGEGSSGINVRGGGSDQNAFYINKVPIYNTSHLFGFFPAFNADIIKDFSIYKGYIPVQYGGHLSSVFNITTRPGNRKYLTARGGISPITANVVAEGPIKKDVSSFMLSARASYSDWILQKIDDENLKNSNAGFNDLSGGLNYDLGKSQLSVFGYHSYDRLSYSDLNSYEYSNNGASANFSHTFGNSLRGEFSVIASQYAFSTIDKLDVSNAFKHSYKLEHYEFRADFKHTLNEKHTLVYGIGSIAYILDRGNVLPYGTESLRKEVALGFDKGLESAVYISDMYDIAPSLNLTFGIRYALYTPMGPDTVYQYLPDQSMDVRNIYDTLTFGNNEPIKSYSEPDLRFALNIKTDAAGSIKLAFNQMHQNLFMLNTTAAIAPNTQWKLADYHLLPSESNQYSAGIFRTFSQPGLEASAEFFFKQTRNSPEFKDGADFLNNPLVETEVLQGDQQAWGIEFFLKRSLRKVEGWLSYTYSHSMIRIDGGEDWNQINGGEAYPANFDIPHALNLVLNYHVTRRVTFASIFTYQTGKPVTYPVSMYYVNGLPVLDYSKRNAYRIPDYLRVDFSLSIEGNLKKKKPLHSSFVFSLYNSTGRDNAYSVYYKIEDGVINSYQYSVIGVPVFTATWLFKLGNYASE